MSTLLDVLQTCQYDTSVVTAAGALGQVKSGSSTDIDVTPQTESGRKVHTAVQLTAGSSAQQTAAVNGSSPVVQVSQEGSDAEIFGALENVNTGTERCSVKTNGTVLFRKASATGPAAFDPATDVGKDAIQPIVNTSTAGDNVGMVTVGANSGQSRAVVLGGAGNYLLVQLVG